MSKIRVMIGGDHDVVRQGLKSVLAHTETLEVVAEAGSVAEAVEAAARAQPDVVVMDVRLPDGTGIEACRDIRAARPQTRVLILTSSADDDAVYAAILAGAAGYLLKQTRGRNVASAIESVAHGETLLDPAILGKVLARVRDLATGAYTDKLAALCAQERGILELIAAGKTNHEIGDTIHLSEGTVKNYVSTLLRKLQVQRRTQAAAFLVTQRALGHQ